MALLVGFGAGCQWLRDPAPPPAAAVSPPQWWSAEPQAPRSPFYVVVEGRDGYEGSSSSLRLCPVTNAVFLCSPALRFDAGEFVDPGTTSVEQVIGTWPERLWGTRSRQCKNIPSCVPGDDLFRWRDAGWARVGFIPHRPLVGEFYLLSEWSGGRLLALVSTKTQAGRKQKVVVHGEPVQVPPAAYEGRVLYWTMPVGPGAVAVHGVEGELEDGEVFLERWEHEQRVTSVPLPEGSWRLRAARWTDIALLAREERQAMRLDGERWTPLELPAWGEAVQDYAHDGLDEWVLMTNAERSHRESSGETRLFLRTGAGAWSEVSLPPPQFSRPGDDERLQPTELHVAGPADIWLRASYVADCVERGVILHNQPPRQACFLERNAQLCTAAPAPRPRQTCDADRRP